MSRNRHPFAVRKVTSGRVAGEKWIVVMNPAGRRVSVHAHIGREGAQAEADGLNIVEMVKPHAEDPRPYAERRAEAEAAYRAEMSGHLPTCGPYCAKTHCRCGADAAHGSRTCGQCR